MDFYIHLITPISFIYHSKDSGVCQEAKPVNEQSKIRKCNICISFVDGIKSNYAQGG